VLVADDNDLNRRILTRQLERLGMHVTAVDGGREAVDAARATRFDAILMDCRMPEVDGYTAARTIRDDTTAPNAGTPILAVTANALPEDRERCRAAGMEVIVTKPIALDDLREALAGVLVEPPVDEAALMQMREELMDDELLASVIERYAAELDGRAAEIRAAIEAGDPARLADAAHVLAAPSATIGLTRLGALCRELEAAARNGESSAAFGAVEAELARVVIALPALASRTGG
jgi:CheY-like chemotaxis protein